MGRLNLDEFLTKAQAEGKMLQIELKGGRMVHGQPIDWNEGAIRIRPKGRNNDEGTKVIFVHSISTMDLCSP